MKCSICGAENEESLENCCWVTCVECRKEICGRCGGQNISRIDMDEDDDEAQYWCCRQCNDCGLQGCAMCV